MRVYVVVPNRDEPFARAIGEAGGRPAFEHDAEAIDGHPIAHGRLGHETVERVRALAARGERPLARGGLDSRTTRACAEAGAFGVVIDAAFWLLPESPLDERDRDAVRGLSLRDFDAGDIDLPSGVRVGRDALLAPFVLRRHGTLRRAIAALHDEFGDDVTEDVTDDAHRDDPAATLEVDALPTPAATVDASFETEPLEESVAIVGAGAVVPRAGDVATFWRNVLAGVDAITEVPPERWNPAVHFNPDPSAPDRTYAKIGGFVTGFAFDPLRFRIPPATVRALDPVQLMALTAASEALADAGYAERAFDRSRCAVILGNSLGGERKDLTGRRMHVAEIAAAMRTRATSDDERARIDDLERELLDGLPSITEDTMPGELSNVIAGRVANALDLAGKNLTTDAACASSHAALDTAVKALVAREADMVLCGGADRSMDAATYVKFCKIGALSPTGSRPFDADADGFVMGEGAVILALKRLGDAVRDGDRIYAVVRAIGASSDGKGKGITAPNPQGQKLAMRRAFAGSGIEPRHIGLLEAHGTSTRVGDVVEIESATEVFEGVEPGTVALGSVKSQIGHLKSAAGAVATLKAALALHDRVLPPSINLRTPNPNVDWSRVPFFVNTDARPWPEPPGGEPRRAGVSAFGFGGTNFHVILEEYVPAYHARAACIGGAVPASDRAATVAADSSERPDVREAAPGEVVVIGANSLPELARDVAGAADAVANALGLEEAASTATTRGAHALEHRFAVGATSLEDLGRDLTTAADVLGADPPLLAGLALKVRGAAYGSGPRPDGGLAFVFPGQGSQYANMCARLVARYPVARRTFDEADDVLGPLIGRTLTSLVFVDPDDADAIARAEEALRETEVTQPAMLAADVAIHRILLEHGLEPSMVAGHSLGEYAALVAAGVLTFADALVAVSARGREMASVHVDDLGLMASLGCGPRDAGALLERVEGYAVVANLNCPVQTIVAGETAAIRRAVELADEGGIDAAVLPVSAAFHSRIVAPASEPLRRVLERLDVRSPRIPVYTNVDATPYPDDPDAIRDVLATQMASPVRWIDQLERMYAAGARVFVEAGPKRALSGFVDATLGDRGDIVSVVTNHPKRGDVESMLDALARLAVLGFEVATRPESGTRNERARDARTSVPSSSPRSAPQREQEGNDVDVVVSGASIGLPGRAHRVFDDANAERLFAGENRIDRLDEGYAARFLAKGITRLVKDGGDPRMERVDEAGDVIKLAGRRGELDVARDYGIDPKLAESLDVTSALAIAAGLEALADAGIPLVREEVLASNGRTLPGGWVLPPALQDDTGIVFASAFPGFDNFARELSAHHDGGGFPRDFLFRILSLGHAQLAQLIRARGPNTQVNAACSSTTLALGVAEDWIRTGRCRRVIVVGADDATSDAMLEWIGSGFLAAGAATTADTVEDGVLPFDARRHGMVIGMGAVGMVLERAEDVGERGMNAVARLVATRLANSAYHGSRLDVDHIAREASALVGAAARRLGVEPAALARETVFVSHETYTPARGGSASAEAAALRAAFDGSARDVLVTNTKGFTGHPMGAGIEDALAVKALQFGRVPPIANLRDVDPEFADLQLSRGGAHERRYALRFSAGFGSQLAMAFFERVAIGDRRVVDQPRYDAFLAASAGVGGARGARTERDGRVLRLVSDRPSTPRREEPRPAARPVAAARPVPTHADDEPVAPVVDAAPAPVPVADGGPADASVLERVTRSIAAKTGYPAEMLDPALDMEADLGIDTVKQAELFSELREEFGIPRLENLKLKDYPTIERVAAFMAEHATKGRSSNGQSSNGHSSDGQSSNGRARRNAPQTTTEGRAPSSNGHAPAPPPGERLRRLVPRVVPAPVGEAVARTAFVVGDGETATAVRERFPDAGGDVAIVTGDARSLFEFARAHADELDSGSLGVLAVTQMGGTHGIDRAGDLTYAGVAGVAKALAREFPGAFLRALDVDPREPLGERAEHVAHELRTDDDRVEIGRTRAGRVAVATVEAPPEGQTAPDLPIEQGSVVVATGGGRGITAEALTAVATAGPTLILLGRTPPPGPDDGELDEAATAALRDAAARDLRGRGERVTPVAVERAFAPRLARAEIARTVTRLRELGAAAEYVSVDVTDAGALAAVLDDVRARHGRIDGVVHAAGAEESRRLADKDEAAFDRAWASKAAAAFELARLTEPDRLRFFVMFGSVAGRFGNAGQADYAAANDALAKLARTLRGRGVPASVFAWGPWGETGMATRGSALDVLRAAGVTPIATDAGVRAFVHELARLDEAEVVLANELGAFEGSDGRGEERTRRIVLRASDPAIDDHRVDGVPYLAGVLGLRAFADVAGEPTRAFEDVRFEYPVKLLRDESVTVNVEVARDGLAALTTDSDGPQRLPRTHFRARVVAAAGAAPEARPFERGASVAVVPDSIYPPLFHGPAFRVLDHTEWMDDGRAEITGRAPAPAIGDMAATVEGAFQALGTWALATHGVMALPERARRIALWPPFDPARTTYRVFGARLDGDRVVGDVECVADGRVVAVAKGVALLVVDAAPRERTGASRAHAGP